MKRENKNQTFTERELDIMKILWESTDGLFLREIVDRHPEPRPHQNTIATIIKILEEKGHVKHESIGNMHRYIPITPKIEARNRSFRILVSDFFGNSYKNAVSALVKDEKISVDELREIIDLIEKNKS